MWIGKFITDNPNASIVSFTLVFDGLTGEISNYNYRISVPISEGAKLYDVEYVPGKQVYKVHLFKRVDEAYSHLIGSELTGRRFTEVLDQLDYKSTLGAKYAYGVFSTLKYESKRFSSDLSFEHYMIDKNKIVRLSDNKKVYPPTFEFAFIGGPGNRFLRSYIFGK